MIYFSKSDTLKNKIAFSFTILVIFGIGLSIFFTNRYIFKNYKVYYLQSYMYVLPYRMKELLSLSRPYHVSGMSTSSSPYAKSVPVLVYHGVLGGNAEAVQGEATNITLDKFWDQMKSLKEAGWNTITMQDFYDFKLGKKKLPAKSFLLTFDDGRKDSYYPADPILKALGFHSVMFVIDKYSLEENSKYYLSKEELAKMSKSETWEIQSHGYSSHSEYPINNEGNKGHFFSNKLWLPEQGRLETTNEFTVRIIKDLEQAKNNLEKAFGTPVIAFAFPFGDYGGSTINFPNSEKTIIETVENVYPLSFYQYSSTYRYSQNYAEPNDSDGRFIAKRIGIVPKLSGKDLVKIFEGGYAKELPYTANLSTKDGWVNTTWGTMTLENNELKIGSFDDSTGSTVVLDGTNTWDNYEITARVKWIKGSNIYLAARYQDDNNLAMCNFKNDLVHVEQIHNGELRVIAGVENEFYPGDNEFTVGMKVYGRNVDCSINGKTIVSTDFLEEDLSSGGVGIKTWDQTPGNSMMIVKSLEITPIKI